MTKRKLVTLSMQPEDLELLNAIAAEVDLSKSELVRRMLYKISFDDKNKAIIKRGNVIALYNAHSVKGLEKSDGIEQKNNPGHDSREDSSSLDPTESLLTNDQIVKRVNEIAYKAEHETITMEEQREYIRLRRMYDIRRTIEIAQTRWIEED